MRPDRVQPRGDLGRRKPPGIPGKSHSDRPPDKFHRDPVTLTAPAKRNPDLKLWPGDGRAWDWRETQTRRVPGVQVADVQELVANGAETGVLSRGMLLMLQTCPETRAFLKTERIPTHVSQTREAVRLYNALAAGGERVAALFHSTC